MKLKEEVMDEAREAFCQLCEQSFYSERNPVVCEQRPIAFNEGGYQREERRLWRLCLSCRQVLKAGETESGLWPVVTPPVRHRLKERSAWCGKYGLRGEHASLNCPLIPFYIMFPEDVWYRSVFRSVFGSFIGEGSNVSETKKEITRLTADVLCRKCGHWLGGVGYWHHDWITEQRNGYAVREYRYWRLCQNCYIPVILDKTLRGPRYSDSGLTVQWAHTGIFPAASAPELVPVPGSPLGQTFEGEFVTEGSGSNVVSKAEWMSVRTSVTHWNTITSSQTVS